MNPSRKLLVSSAAWSAFVALTLGVDPARADATGGGSPMEREPQVDPVTGRVERLPPRRTAAPPRLALSSAALAAALRLAAVEERVGLSPVVRDGRTTHHLSVAGLDESELRAWFDDLDVFRGRGRDSRWNDDIARAYPNDGETAGPSSEQLAALEDEDGPPEVD